MFSFVEQRGVCFVTDGARAVPRNGLDHGPLALLGVFASWTQTASLCLRSFKRWVYMPPNGLELVTCDGVCLRFVFVWLLMSLAVDCVAAVCDACVCVEVHCA